jgi:uncharacterized protein (DUF169 family)
MPNYQDLESRLTSRLQLSRAPVAVSFCAEPPAGVRRFLGQVPSGCTFWSIAATAAPGKSAFYTLPADHYNCPIGAYTHRVDLPAERAHELTDVLGVMAKLEYVSMDEVPQIPRWPRPPAAIVYARLGEAPLLPDVVIVAGSAQAVMLLGEASRAAGANSTLPPLPRPTCMAIPAAAGQGTTLSLACIGNRVYTEIGEGDIYAMMRGADLERVVAKLGTIAEANQQLNAYHEKRRADLTRL